MAAHNAMYTAIFSGKLTMGKTILAGALTVLFIFSNEARAEMTDTGISRTTTPTIQIAGTGAVQARPDIATINIGVSTEDGNPQNAVSRNNAATSKVISEVEAGGIEKKDLRTSNFSVYPQYRTEGENKRQVVTYRVSNTVTVTIRDLDKVGDILTKVVSAGSNQISGPNFSVSNPEKYLDEARKKAVENAMSKANAYASAAGLKLGTILAMSEEATAAPVFRGPMAMAKPGGSVPIEAGEESLQAQISLVIELKS
jgi:uncharacterized protein YggE